ncbi:MULTISPECIES: hypothetical protein [unclassified Crossiella]|uniref:hypothetical protein n=1 Tax=unclassified Crossiella TaxID=2620835 RepID=UPI001FFFC836|nr:MULTISPECIES: hypothetical protein [unclassified Crossiella]MCK2245234.1 hypothetical protein [Crossiella sp. S99.2]MCK2258844.1 hypothetical protein [Crossiella sp. S99.1]
MISRLEWHLAQQEDQVRDHGRWDQVQAVASGADPVLSGTPQHELHELYFSIMSLAARKIWASSGKSTYSIHPGLLAALRTSQSGELPRVIFERLQRHPNPLVIFPQPIPATLPDGAAANVHGFLVHGRLAETRGGLCGSDDPQRRGIGVIVIAGVLDHHGVEVSIDQTQLTLPLVTDHFTIDQIVDQVLTAFAPQPGIPLASERQRDWLILAVRLVLHVLLYLCSEGADIAERSLPTRNSGQNRNTNSTKNRAPKPAKIYQVGATHGPQLLATAGYENLGRGVFRAVAAAHEGELPRLLFHQAHQLDDLLTAALDDLSKMRQQLHITGLARDTLQARVLELEKQTAAQSADLKKAMATCERWQADAESYRAQAEAVGSPEQLAELRLALEDQAQQLAAAHRQIDELGDQAATYQNERARRRHYSPAVVTGHQSEPAPDSAEELVPATWEALLSTARALPHLWFSPAIGDTIANLQPRPAWLAAAWNSVRALSHYAQAKHRARVIGDSMTTLRNFSAYLHEHSNGTKISAAQVALSESDAVINNPRLSRVRIHPVPVEIDDTGTCLYLAHVRIGHSPPRPRLHFRDETDNHDVICIAYIGPHLPIT